MTGRRIELGIGSPPPNDYEPTAAEIDSMDDAVHILYPGNTTLCLCGLKSRRIRIAITDEWPDSGSGCWTCLMEARRIRTGDGCAE